MKHLITFLLLFTPVQKIYAQNIAGWDSSMGIDKASTIDMLEENVAKEYELSDERYYCDLVETRDHELLVRAKTEFRFLISSKAYFQGNSCPKKANLHCETTFIRDGSGSWLAQSSDCE
ncbi:MAG: hypothetical protein OM95_05440 [Bdellovibrio sp. ArHS]|uniref:hypothetical protein n=1 Tax=Bdellovibrio sp. ArHS TaxID=1569284 RepID=UPI00058304E0|nr:hypothetical protein [Bdellovibrio sp. ArHS]KHD88921.1 MAG: hypothetical protein OM95_05440 [Bdellovibrio sp. ArHS]